MHITILTSGTRGDTQPYIALGVGLRRAGHAVRVVGSQDFAPLFAGYDLEFKPMSINLGELLNSSAGQAVLEVENPLAALMKQRSAMKGVDVFEQVQQELWDWTQDTDALIFHPGLTSGYFIARERGIPCVMASPFPISPTSEWPSALFYEGPRLGSLYNRMTHVVFEQMFWQMTRGPIAKFWQARPDSQDIPRFAPFAQQRREGMLTLYGISEAVLPRPADWPASEQITGYWFLEPTSGWTPPPELTAFLEAGPPPVYIGFGSMGSARRTVESTEIALRALELTGQRGILLTGSRGLSADHPLPSTVYGAKDLPHTWLFPRMAAVVHHGGAGTTAAGLRAGVPSVIVPHSVDQPMWGRRVLELGVGAPPIPRAKLTAERLAHSIQKALEPATRQAAAALGERIRAEDGVAKAVRLINQALQGG